MYYILAFIFCSFISGFLCLFLGYCAYTLFLAIHIIPAILCAAGSFSFFCVLIHSVLDYLRDL